MLVIDVETNCISVCRVATQTKEISHKKTYFCSLPEVVKEYILEPNHHLLLPESTYLFHTIHMEYACNEPFTITLYKQLLQEKKESLVSQYGCDPFHMSIIPHVAGELGEWSVKHLLWRSWKFMWTWYMYALSADMVLTLQQAYGSLLPAVTYVPRNLATITSFAAILQRNSFTLLTISDQTASLCQIENWWYSWFATVPLWLHILLEATEDQWVQKYLFRDHDDLQRNSVAQKLLLDSLGFYASALSDWVGWFLVPWSPLLVCCRLVTHELFTEVVQASLQNKGAFVLPFSTMPYGPGQKQSWNIDFAVGAYVYF